MLRLLDEVRGGCDEDGAGLGTRWAQLTPSELNEVGAMLRSIVTIKTNEISLRPLRAALYEHSPRYQQKLESQSQPLPAV